MAELDSSRWTPRYFCCRRRGYAPMSRLERLVPAVEGGINGRDRKGEHPAWGEDVKIRGIRNGSAVELTVACAMIGRHIPSFNDYLTEKASLEALIRELAANTGSTRANLLSMPRNEASGRFYLAIAGTSAETGDDGEVGRGNRAKRPDYPGLPMSLEALAVKNPVNHPMLWSDET